jgi:nucleoside-diphosphate-sugar epimerase
MEWSKALADQVVVFGGSGFIGTHLVRRLVAEGHRVISVDVKTQRETLDGVDYRQCDVRDLGGFSVDGRVDRIYNFAAVHTTPGHPTHEYYETNILGALEITRFAAENGVPEIIFTSSISVYGPSEEMKTEQTPPAPESAYGHSKLISERVHRQWLDAASGRKLTVVRPAVVFGAGERGNFTRLAGLLKKGFFIYPGRKDTIKACIYVEDLLDAVEFARQKSERYVLFNGAYPQRYTLERIVTTLASSHFSRARTLLVPKAVVLLAARMLKLLDAFHMGIHPDRVMKLVRSTDVYPAWLVSQGLAFPNAIERAISLWAEESKGEFV